MVRQLLVSLGLAGMVFVANPALAQDRLLFVGNSYTFYSGGLDSMVDSLLEEATGADVDAQAVNYGGYRLPQHLADADGTNGETALREALVTGERTDWNLVVLQDQSQIPAFPMTQAEWGTSRDAAVALNELIEPTGAHTMFFLTWGRRDGDSQNPGRFPDYRVMQGYLTEGYEAYRDASSSVERPAYIAPVGLAFELVYDDVLEGGGVPEDEDSAFHQLYTNDGSHPSIDGSYLAASVIFAAYSGVSPESLEWAPDGMATARRDYLQMVAAEAVFETTDGWLYPWTSESSEDVGPSDVGADIGTTDAGGADVDAGLDATDTTQDSSSSDDAELPYGDASVGDLGSETDVPPPASNDPGGCSSSRRGKNGPLLLSLVGLLACVRRRSR